MAVGRPNSNEYAPYYKGYVKQIDTDDIIEQLNKDSVESLAFYKGIETAKWDYAYDEGKWTIKQVLRHIIDTERIFAYRMLRISRGDQTQLAGFDQNQFVRNIQQDATSENLIKEFDLVRQGTLILLDSIEEKDWTNMGSASENDVSTRAMAYLIAGHEVHHRKIIAERYLAKP